MKKLLGKIGKVIGKVIGSAFGRVGKIPLADILLVLGLGSLGYGLSLLRMWLAFSVIGLILLIVAIGLGKGEKP